MDKPVSLLYFAVTLIGGMYSIRMVIQDMYHETLLHVNKQLKVKSKLVLLNYVNSLFRWYAGRIARNKAERLVLQNNLPRGTFLIRERESDTRKLNQFLVEIS